MTNPKPKTTADDGPDDETGEGEPDGDENPSSEFESGVGNAAHGFLKALEGLDKEGGPDTDQEVQKAFTAFLDDVLEFGHESIEKALVIGVTLGSEHAADGDINKGAGVMTEDVKKSLDALTGVIKSLLPQAQSAHFSSLASEADKLAFVSKSFAEREALVTEISKAGLPESVLKQLTEAEDLKKRFDAMEQTALAETFAKRAAPLGVDGALLLDIHKANPELVARVETVLKAKAEQIRKGGLFSEIGSSQSDPNGTDAESVLKAKAAEIIAKNPMISYAKAYGMALDQNPNLYAETRVTKRL